MRIAAGGVFFRTSSHFVAELWLLLSSSFSAAPASKLADISLSTCARYSMPSGFAHSMKIAAGGTWAAMALNAGESLTDFTSLPVTANAFLGHAPRQSEDQVRVGHTQGERGILGLTRSVGGALLVVILVGRRIQGTAQVVALLQYRSGGEHLIDRALELLAILDLEEDGELLAVYGVGLLVSPVAHDLGA